MKLKLIDELPVIKGKIEGKRKKDEIIVDFGEEDNIVIELKIRRSESLESVIKDGLLQTRAYIAECGADEGHLIIFDKNEARTYEEKIFRREESGITVWGM